MIAVALSTVREHSSSLFSISVRGLGVLAGFAVTLLIGRYWGPEANGIYAIVTQTALMLSIFAVGGLDLAVVRFFSGPTARGKRVEFGSLLKVCAICAAAALVLCFIMLIKGEAVLGLLGTASLSREAVYVICILIITRALIRLLGGFLRSQKAYVFGQAIDCLLIPLALALLLGLGFLDTIEQALVATALCALLTIIVAILMSVRHIAWPSITADNREAVSLKPVLVASAPLWGVAVAMNISDWYGLAVVASSLSITEAGLYRVAMQIGMAFSIISTGLFGVFSAKISVAYAENKPEIAAKLAQTGTKLSAALVIPPAIVLFALADFVLGLIGPEFTSASGLLRTAIIGQILFIILGPAGLTLAMAGHGRTNLTITLISTLLLLVAAPIIVNYFGAIGVVAWISMALVGRNVASVILLKRVAGISILTGTYKEPPR